MSTNSETSSKELVLSASRILHKVAGELGLTGQQVERTLAEANINLTSPVSADRRVRLLRLRVRGVKHTGEPFAIDQNFTPGVWAIVHHANSAGKTSWLEFLVLPLRGAPRDLPDDVLSWLQHVSLDVMVAGRPIRISIDAGAGTPAERRSSILTADSEEELQDAEDDSLRLLDEAHGAQDVERSIGAFFLDALRMGRTSLWQSNGGTDGEGAAQVHGWASYFGACYLNPGGEELLLGDVKAVGLSARLMDVFVDLPYSTVLTQLSVAGKREQKTATQQKRRSEADAEARSEDRAQWKRQLEHTRHLIEEVRAEAGRETTSLLAAADEAAAALQAERSLLQSADQDMADAYALRIRCEQALLDAQETWQARRVLGRLNPVCCPRCEEPFTRDRARTEQATAACGVCTRPMPETAPELAEALLQDLKSNLANARTAEEEAKSRRDAQAAAMADALATHQAADTALRQALATSQNQERLRALEIEAAGLEGRLAATGPRLPDPTGSQTNPGQIVGAVTDSVRDAVTAASKDLFPVMNREIVELATRFGVQNLDSVNLDRSGKVNAVKAGVKTKFSKLSRGDRLRMRIATVIALLRVGAERNLVTHPGVLLIDSVAAEEVTKVPARTLIAELQAIAKDLPDLQIVLTTAQPELVDALPPDHIITSDGEHLF
ncbi:hypothetical protein ACWGAN_22540 [Streptomyces sp. NPDC054945]